ncbi:MAG: hypothetical protein IAG13_27180, partial [Deltaproteobacteria bacterium]|nr:hypothetical protein [Nannocystaceae bacterium]
ALEDLVGELAQGRGADDGFDAGGLIHRVDSVYSAVATRSNRRRA